MCVFSKDLFFSIFSTKPRDLLVKVEVSPTPSDATVTLTCDGYTQQGNSIMVPVGSVVSWRVEKSEYETRSSDILVTGSTMIPVKISSLPKRTVSIVTVPQDASVILTGDGYVNEQGTKAITVPIGTELTYTVTDPLKQLSLPKTGRIVVQEDTSIEVVMDTKISINKVEPQDAVVVINGDVGTYKETPCNQSITVSVSKEGYNEFRDELTVNDRGIVPDFVRDVELQETLYSLTVDSDPLGAEITVSILDREYNGVGRVVVDGVRPGSNVTILARLDGYTDLQTTEFQMPEYDYGITVSLQRTVFLVAISAVPSLALVSIFVNGSLVSSGNGMASTYVTETDSVSYSVSYNGIEQQEDLPRVSANYESTVVLNPYEDGVSLITSRREVVLPIGRYMYVAVGGGGGGENGGETSYPQGTYVGTKNGAGGGGSGYVSTGTFVVDKASGSSIVFTPGAGGNEGTDGEATTIDKDGQTIVIAKGGKRGGASGTGVGGDGGSGGGCGAPATAGERGISRRSSGGRGGHRGCNGESLVLEYTATPGGNPTTYKYTSQGGKGTKNKDLYYSAQGGGLADTYGLPGDGGPGVIKLADSLMTIEGLLSATQDSVYNAIGGGGGGGSGPSPTTGIANGSLNRSAGSGGGGGGWDSGQPGYAGANNGEYAGGRGGNGAIIYARIAWE